uniref:Reverse transcriptase domain-containing protein n=1 Tax=Megaselia scalaris TaxID=36166 RepID=T1H2F3_MEGSC
MFITHSNHKIASDELQYAVTLVNYELKRLDLELSPHKCKTLLFSKKRPDYLQQIIIDNTYIENVQSFNFLGFEFDSKLKCGFHIKSLSSKCSKFINILRSLCGVSWGANPFRLLMVYKGAIRPKLDYLSPLYIDSAKNLLIRTISRNDNLALTNLERLAGSYNNSSIILKRKRRILMKL